MASPASSVSRVLTRAFVVLAALFLAMGPSLDTAAHAATRFDGTEQPVVRILAAFDVIADVTDHIPGDPPKSQIQQMSLVMSWPAPIQPAVELPDERDNAWPTQLSAPLVSAFSDRQDDPPRG